MFTRLRTAAFRIICFVHLVVAWIVYKLQPEGVEGDLRSCIRVVDQFGATVPAKFIEALVNAEDHRSALHFGVDPIAILRAFMVRIKNGEIQGASTIEQQFVRVVTKRYERTIGRKVREQFLAAMLSLRRPKRSIASAYLSIAYYGTSIEGIGGLRKHFGQNLWDVDYLDALEFIAQLKYPRPAKDLWIWRYKIDRRVAYIARVRSKQPA
ncbi:MAG: transglycosylase domain-containing protein [Rhodospirillaceae bacterium]|nr:transglycosylase domain-containing protein [Rhodospirillaceae bacterium]MDE0255306.1 transglycosylase domain-containing protein [Rhodospirillaceae bacterium]MDE0618716.1 transglycosylase domain-containing protein [Rhodospirillaceae bacterium]